MATLNPEQKSERNREERLAHIERTLAAWDGQAGQLFYLSAATAERGFSGAAIVLAPDELCAVPVAHRLGIQLRGQILIIPVASYEAFPPEIALKYSGRYLSREDLEQLNRETEEMLRAMVPEQRPDVAELVADALHNAKVIS